MHNKEGNVMKKETTSNRLKSLMESRGLKQVDVIKLTQPFCEKHGVKMTKSDISQYVSGKVKPSQEKLVILCMALNVSEAWLVGFDVPCKRCTENLRAEWKYNEDDEPYCSNCGTIADIEYNDYVCRGGKVRFSESKFCSNCGRQMY